MNRTVPEPPKNTWLAALRDLRANLTPFKPKYEGQTLSLAGLPKHRRQQLAVKMSEMTLGEITEAIREQREYTYLLKSTLDKENETLHDMLAIKSGTAGL